MQGMNNLFLTVLIYFIKKGFIDNRSIKGMVTLGSLMTRLLSKKIETKTPVEKVLYGQFKRVTLDTTLSKVSRILDRDHYCLVVYNQRYCKLQSFMYFKRQNVP